MNYSENVVIALKVLPIETWNTVYMVIASAFFSTLIGLPLGVFLLIFPKNRYPVFYRALETLVNIGRSFPFAVLMVALIPVTRFIVGTSLGTTASIVPLSITAIPFVARIVETSLLGVDKQLIEAALIMGSTTWQMVTKVFLREAAPSIISGLTLTVVNLIGYSAMAGLIGGGGLGQVAIQYGYNRFNTFIMGITVFLLLVIVQIAQWIGNSIVHRMMKRRGLKN